MKCAWVIFLTICMLGNFAGFFDCYFFFFFQINFFKKKSLRKAIKVSNSLDAEQASQHLLGLIWVQTVCIS